MISRWRIAVGFFVVAESPVGDGVGVIVPERGVILVSKGRMIE